MRGKPGTSFQESSSGGVTLEARNSPSNECHSSCEMLSTREAAHYRLSVQGFYWTLIAQAACARQIPKFQAARGKAGVQHKTYRLHKQLRCSEPLLSIRGIGTLLNPKFPDASQRPVL